MCLLFMKIKGDEDVTGFFEEAWDFAVEWNNLPAKGRMPPVQVRPKPWLRDGRMIKGNFKWWKCLWIKRERVLVADGDEIYIMPILVHEFTHCLRWRNGLPVSEAICAFAADAMEETLELLW